MPGIHNVGEMRVVTVALRSRASGRIAGYVQYGRDEQHVDSTVGRLWLFIAAGVLGATLLASFAGMAIARRAMRPISSLTATARDDRRYRRPVEPHAAAAEPTTRSASWRGRWSRCCARSTPPAPSAKRR